MKQHIFGFGLLTNIAFKGLILSASTFGLACGGANGDGAAPADAAPALVDCQAVGAASIYILDNDFNLASLDLVAAEAGQDPFTDIGKVDCATGDPVAGLTEVWPYSMTSDRNGHIWLFFTSGEIFELDVATMACTKTNWQGPNANDLVLMAFGGTDPQNESLFMMLFAADGLSPARFAEVNPLTFEVGPPHDIADDQGYVPYLAGTSDGKLLTYRPVPGKGIIESIDLVTGQPLEQWDVPGHSMEKTPSWSFGVLGHKAILFTFTENVIGARTHKIDSFDPTKPEGQRLTPLLTNSPRQVLLAGNSTCVPPWGQD